MRNPQVVPDQGPPLEAGFMRSGFFAWPSRKIKCKGCGVVFESTNGNVHRCQECRPKHKKELQKRWRKKHLNSAWKK